jgi:hypothetical protein
MMQSHSKVFSYGPTITSSSPLLSGEIGFAYSVQLTGTGGVSPYSWAVTGGSLPAGLILSSNGRISGTPSGGIGTSVIAVQITDGAANKSPSVIFNLTVVALVSITTISPLPSGTTGTAYSTTLAATGGATPYVWARVSNTGANTWSVSSSGVITGTPGTAETDTITVSVTDLLGYSVQQTFSLTVSSVGNAIGFNALGQGVAYGETSLPFINIVKSGGISSGVGPYNWATQTTPANSGNTNEEAQLNLDSNGYPLQIPQPGLTGTVVTCFLNAQLPTAPGTSYPYAAPNTQYTVLWDGAGTIVIGLDASATLTASGQTFTVSTPTINGLFLSITASTLGNHITNLRVVETALLASFNAGAIFHPNYLPKLTGVTSLRFMNALATNTQVRQFAFTSSLAAGATSATIQSVIDGGGVAPHWFFATGTYPLTFSDGTNRNAVLAQNGTTCDWSAGGGALPNAVSSIAAQPAQIFGWSSRAQLSNCFYGTSSPLGIPAEIAIALCNAVGADLWYNVPATYTDADIQSLGTLVNSTLNSGLNAYFELANENWNGHFSTGVWTAYKGTGAGFGTGFNASNNYYGMRCAQMAVALQTAFGSSFSRCFPIIAGQWANIGVLQQAMATALWSGGPASNFSNYPIKIATVAGYFGMGTSVADTQAIMAGGLNAFFACMTGNVIPGGATLTSVPSNGWIGLDTVGGTIAAGPNQGSFPGIAGYLSFLASFPNLKFAAYESGYGLEGDIPSGVAGWGAFLQSASRDARMGTAFTTYMNWWKTNVGGRDHPNLLFFDVDANGTTFQWASWESSQQSVSTPPARAAAINAFIAGH